MKILNNSTLKMSQALSENLDFHDKNSNYSSHNFHSFPAKFPPQLPKHFIETLTEPGDIVLDPMAGSATTILEGYLCNRKTIGLDIDPLALLIAHVKTTTYDQFELSTNLERIVAQAKDRLENSKHVLENELNSYWDSKSKAFIDYWFAPHTQLQLYSLLVEIKQLQDQDVQNFFLLLFSSIIITKSGGVSLALDLGHTRPHKAKNIIYNNRTLDRQPGENNTRSSKIIRSPFEELYKKGKQNIKSVLIETPSKYKPQILKGNAQKLDIDNDYVDLIITSPPYASNAIDYMRAHKFSLVWFGHSIDELSKHRATYIGGESINGLLLEALPPYTERIVKQITMIDHSKGSSLRRYYSEMKLVLKEMLRVLKPGKPTIIVVGNSVMRGISTNTAECIVDIGKSLGFENPIVNTRNLDRNRRMMPTSQRVTIDSQIQKRMHQEFVIGFTKPCIQE